MRPALRHLALACLAILGSCDMFGGSSDQGNSLAGGSSDQGNAIHVRVLDRFGDPVANARLEFVPTGWMSASMPESLGYVAHTDSLGDAVVEVAPGSYAVQGQEGFLRALAELVVLERKVDATLLLRAPSDVVGILSASDVDTLFVPGTRRYGIVGSDGRFRIDSLPHGADVLCTRDGRRILLDTTGSGYERTFLKPIVFGENARIEADTISPKYVSRLVRPLPLDTARPSPLDTLESWRPDTVFASGDSIIVQTMARACATRANDGLGAWSYAESLYVYKRNCPPEKQGEPVVYRFFMIPRTGIWYVTTLQPIGYTWEMP